MLYLIKSGSNLKIGFTSDLDSRLAQYKVHNPDIRLLNYKSGTREDEKRLHTLCKEYKYSDEWFIYNEEVIDIFNTYISKIDIESSFKYSITINLNLILEGLSKLSKISEYKVLVCLWKYSDLRGKIVLDSCLNNLIHHTTQLTIGTIKNCISSLYKKNLIIKLGKDRGVYYLNTRYFLKK